MIEESRERYINPYTDFDFKKLFGTEMNKDLLISFLNALLDVGKNRITDVQYLNSENLGAGQDDRRSVFDVYCKTKDGGRFSIKPFPVDCLKSFGGGDGYASGFLYGLYSGWELIDCLEFGSAEASMMVASHSCSDDLPGVEAVKKFIKEEKEKYGEMIARG